jgi:hypothetical protein
MNGVLRVKRLISQRKILCTREVWEAGERASGNSFRKAILSYAWDNKEAPKKDGREDPLDALRYDVINWLWRDSDLPSIIKSVEPVISSQIKYNSLFSKTKGF